MNPILLRSIGFLLAAAVAGAGGGYLAVNSKKASPPPVTQSGTVPAIPAQPFPGQGIPAIPAIPAIPPQPVPSDEPGEEVVKDYLWVTQPYGGRGWVRGSTMTMPITWQWTTSNRNHQATKFEVDLLRDGSFYRKIASVETAAGQYGYQIQWSIPTDIEPNQNYKILVYDAKKTDFRATNEKPFSILGESIHIKGRLVDLFTKQQLSGIDLIVGLKTGANGEFSYTAPTAFPGYESVRYYAPNCYMQGSIGAGYSQNVVDYGMTGTEPNVIGANNINSFDFHTGNGIRGDVTALAILSGVLDAEEIYLRPAYNIGGITDIKASFAMDYEDDNWINGPGNYNIAWGFGLNNVFPLGVDTRVVLTDASGKQYFSPFYKLSGDRERCGAVMLTYLGGKFTWQPYNITFQGTGGGGGRVGQSFSRVLSASGGVAPYSWQIVAGTMPEGISLDPSTGVISGKPTKAGMYQFIFTATDASGVIGGSPMSIPIQ